MSVGRDVSIGDDFFGLVGPAVGFAHGMGLNKNIKTSNI